MVNKDWLDIDVLEDYLDGRLDAKSMNRVERAALEDPFVAEALAGLSLSPKRSLASLSLLQKHLQERVSEQQETKKTAVITWQRLSIAATAAVLFISVGIIFWMKQVNYQQNSDNQSKKIDVVIAPTPKDEEPVKAAPEAKLPGESVDLALNSKSNAVERVTQSRVSSSSASALGEPRSGLMEVVISENAVKGKVTDEAVALKEDKTAMNEVVIRGYQKRTREVTTGSSYIDTGKEAKGAPVGKVENLIQGSLSGINVSSGTADPVGGWSAFREYLIKENKYSKDAKPGQTLEFSFVLNNGKPDKIVVVRGLSRKYDREAIRLIKNGPLWELTDPTRKEVVVVLVY